MSSGRTPQGEQAVEVALMLNALMPSTPAKNVFVGAFSTTTTALTGSQPGIDAMHFVVMVVVTPLMSGRLFLLPLSEVYSRATSWARLGSGSSCAPASAAASADACSDRCV